MHPAQRIRIPEVFGSANKLHQELLWLSIASAAILALNVLIGIAVARYLDITDYGRFSYFINLFGVLRLVASLGMTSHITFQLARNHGRGLSPRRTFYSMLSLRLITIGGFALLAILIGYLQGDWILVIAGGAAALALVDDFAIGTLQGLKLSGRVMAVLAAQPIVYALAAVAVFLFRWTVTILYWSYFLSFVLAITLGGAWLLRELGRPEFKLPGARALWSSVRYAGGIYLHAILGTVFTSYATLYLGSLGRFTEAALITIPLNLIFTAGALANMVISTAYFPQQTEMFASQDFVGARSLLRLFFGLVAAATLLLAFTLLFYPRTILYLLYGQRYQASAAILAGAAFTTFFYTLQTVLTFTLVARGRLRGSILGALIPTLILIVIIIFVGSANNALILMALAHCAASVIGFLLQLQKFGAEFPPLLKSIGLHAVVAGVLMGPLRFVMSDTPQHWPYILVLLSVVAAMYMVWVWYRSTQHLELSQSVPS